MASIRENEQNPEIAHLVDSEGKIGDEHYLLSIRQNNEIDVGGRLKETSVDNDEMHRITILNHPKEVSGPSIEIQSRSEVEEHSNSVRSIPTPRGEMCELHSSISGIHSRILPWMNGDGTVNQLVYKGLVRRLLGVVMQHPGMLEVCSLGIYYFS